MAARGTRSTSAPTRPWDRCEPLRWLRGARPEQPARTILPGPPLHLRPGLMLLLLKQPGIWTRPPMPALRPPTIGPLYLPRMRPHLGLGARPPRLMPSLLRLLRPPYLPSPLSSNCVPKHTRSRRCSSAAELKSLTSAPAAPTLVVGAGDDYGRPIPLHHPRERGRCIGSRPTFARPRNRSIRLRHGPTDYPHSARG